MRPEGTEQRRVSFGTWDTIPNFTPDGRWITYSARDKTSWKLWKIPVEGGTPVALSAEERVVREGARSPDGHWIATRDEQSRLAILSAGDGKLVRSFEAAPHASAWSGDSRSLIYPRGSALYIQPLSGGPPRQVADVFPDEISTLEVLSDGTTFICGRTTYHRAAVVLRNFR